MTTKAPFKAALLVAAACFSCPLAAQDAVAHATRTAQLQALASTLYQRDSQDRQAVRAYARRLGIPVRRELPDGRVLELQRLLPGPLLSRKPVFYLTNNIVAADTVSTDEVWPGGSAGLDLDGYGMSVAQWDGGAVYAEHPDFTNRLTQVDGATAVSGHSTHVAGTLIGGGDWLYADSRGMAFAAHLDAYDWNSDSAEMATAAASTELVSNHSYGIAAGWIYMGGSPPDQWWWIGGADAADVEDPNFGYYDSESRLWDQIVYNAPHYLPVKAAGNDRSDFGAGPGEEYTVIDQQGDFLFTSTLPRNPDCAPAGYDCLPGHSVAKNILTVGAVDDLPGGYSTLGGPGAVAMADFSSWGPTDDGRIKPDLVGNGMFLFSAWPDSPYYALAAGTSMAAPNVAGSLLLLQQHYENVHGPGQLMRGATLKALAIHSADEAGGSAGPDYAFGWGLLNTRTAARVISEDGGAHRIIEGSLANGGTQTYPVEVNQSGAVVTATLVWADPPATPVPPTLDPPNLMLVNDLDLRITRGPETWFPWLLDPAAPAAAAGRGDNFRDNVEQVEISDAANGSYTVTVGHKGALLNATNQDYSLIISVSPPPPVGSGFLIDEDFAGGMPAGWSVVTTQGVSWTVKTPVPGDWRLDNNTGGSGQFAMVDNDYTRVLTSLRTPALDLSVNDAAVLRFSSYFFFDFFETINVDVSTDGGQTWSNAWQNMGQNQTPARVVLDLSGWIAGQANVMLRFRYDSQGDPQGNLWQVDDIELEVFGGGTPPVDPPPPVPETLHLTGLSGSAESRARGRWTATVQVTVANQAGDPEPDVTVDGAWSDGAGGASSCVTGYGGSCTVEKSNVKSSTGSVMFTVTALGKTGMDYAPADNVGGDSITVSQSDTDQVPAAVDDSYQTAADTPLNGNVLTNDDPGDGPAVIDSHTQPVSGSLDLSANGAFTYTPGPGFEGSDGFSYRIADQDGDLSNTARVSIEVTGSPPAGTLSLSAAPYKVKGLQRVDLAWQNFTGDSVDISRDGTPPLQLTTPNDGEHTDDIGVKGSGQTYLYEVCETGTSNCASVSASF